MSAKAAKGETHAAPAAPPGTPPERIGAVDIGSNQIRMAIGEFHTEGGEHILERARLPVALGPDTFVSGRLSRRTINAAIDVLRGYRKMFDAYEVSHIRTIATSAVREAANAEAFCDRVYTATGLEVDILRPAEESHLLMMALRRAAGGALGTGWALAVEVGGGSALLALLRGGQTVSADSCALGSVRLLETLDIVGANPVRAASILRHQIGSVAATMVKTMSLKSVRTFVALGGDARFVAQHIGKPLKAGGLWAAPATDFDAFVARMEVQTVEQITRRNGIPFAEAQTLVPALLVYQAIFHSTAARRFTVSDATIRDGLLLDLAGWAGGRPDEVFTAGVLRSAESIAVRYQCDMPHARHVARLALRLFDELQGDHGLSARHRLLLHVAALLHEVGGFVSSRAHHKHSYYLIANSEVFGLRADEQEIVANVARYHRRSSPRRTHMPFVALSRPHRAAVSKLAAILRVADALERGHNQQVTDLTVQRTDDEIVVGVPGVTDLALERLALRSKADLFADTFGLRVRLEET